MPIRSRTAVLVVAGISLLAGTARGVEIRVMTSGAFTAAHLELIAPFERATQDRIVTAATSMGTGPDSIPSRLRRGEPADVVIVADDALDELIKEGLVVAASRVALARSGI